MTASKLIGLDLGSFTFDVERSQLRLFAKAIDERRPVYTDTAAARAAGYRDLPAPPTFPFTIGMKPDDPFELLASLGLELRQVLHAEQSFEYVRPICAGDQVRIQRRIVDVYGKKGGALTFYVLESTYSDSTTDDRLCSSRQVLVSRQME